MVIEEKLRLRHSKKQLVAAYSLMRAWEKCKITNVDDIRTIAGRRGEERRNGG